MKVKIINEHMTLFPERHEKATVTEWLKKLNKRKNIPWPYFLHLLIACPNKKLKEKP